MHVQSTSKRLRRQKERAKRRPTGFGQADRRVWSQPDEDSHGAACFRALICSVSDLAPEKAAFFGAAEQPEPKSHRCCLGFTMGPSGRKKTCSLLNLWKVEDFLGHEPNCPILCPKSVHKVGVHKNIPHGTDVLSEPRWI